MRDIIITPEVAARHPGTKVAYLQVRGVKVTTTPPREKKLARKAEALLRNRLTHETILNNPIVVSWYELYDQMGLDTRIVRPAQVDLALRVLAQRDIPKINNIVDAANIVALSSMCPVGAFDLGRMTDPIMLRLSSEHESYMPLFTDSPEVVPQDEIVYADANGIFSRYSKDAHRTRISEDTTSVLFVIDGTSVVAKETLLQAREQLDAIVRDVGGEAVTIEFGYVEAI